MSTVREAPAFLRSSHIDIVLLDAVHSDGRSEEVGHVARGLGAARIEMSGYPQVMVDLECSDRPHLSKPFGSEKLPVGKASF